VRVLVLGQVLELVPELEPVLELAPHSQQTRPRLRPVPTKLTILYFSPIFLLLLKIQFVPLISESFSKAITPLLDWS